MSASNIFTRTSGNGRSNSGDLDLRAFSLLTFSIVFGWILVSALVRVIENLSFQTLGMNPRSTVHALIIFVVIFIIFVAFIWFVDSLSIIPAGTASSSLTEATGGILSESNPEEDQNTSANAFIRSGRNGQVGLLAPVNYF